MLRLIVLVALVGLCPLSVTAQVSREHKASGYVFIAPGAASGNGATTATLHFGGGADVLVYQGLAAGAEIGYLAPVDSLGDGFGVFSADLSYHFSRRQRLVPFVTGGYSLAFRSGTANGGNFGGGVDYWLRESVGLRFEFRDHVFSNDSTHFFGFRFGLAFR